MPQPVVRARALRKTYGTKDAVAGIDLDVHEGEVVAVLGPNGAGKTTTIEMLLGLRTPTSGEIEIFGRAPADVRARVGAMLQDTDAPESLTVAETIGLVASYYPYRLPTTTVLERADLVAQAGQRVTQLSGGQRARLSFALALVGDPDLLYLDEPTAALDVQARRAFWSHVAALTALGKTILFSTHNLAEADAVAGRIVVISRGRLIHDGTPQEIKALVAGRTLRMTTDAPLDVVLGLPGVRSAAESGAPPSPRAVTVQAATAEPVLRALFAAAYQVHDLIVAEASLEEAFVHLTAEPPAADDEEVGHER